MPDEFDMMDGVAVEYITECDNDDWEDDDWEDDDWDDEDGEED